MRFWPKIAVFFGGVFPYWAKSAKTFLKGSLTFMRLWHIKRFFCRESSIELSQLKLILCRVRWPLEFYFVSVIWYALLNMEWHTVAAFSGLMGFFMDTLRTKQFHRIDTI